MSTRRCTTGAALIVLIVINLLLAAAVFGQTDPTLMQSGVRGSSGPGGATLVGVPSAYFFVLTDVRFSAQLSPGDACEMVVVIDGVITGQRAREVQLINLPAGSAFQTVPLSMHLTTGIAFPPGDEVTVRVENILNNRVWYVNYSGYLVSQSPGAVGGESPSVTRPQLGQNVPNPFNPTTRIAYTLASAEDIKLRFFDSQGRAVRTLVDGRREAGEHAVTWDGRDDSGQPLPSGVYYYELVGAALSEARKAIILK